MARGSLGLLLVGIVGSCWLTTDAADVPVQKGLTIHEWGVINQYADIDLANADMRAMWAGLPKFVYGQVDRRTLPQPRATIVTAPVIYFYSPQQVRLQLRIDFPGGKPAVWWPGNSNIPPTKDKPFRDAFLEWQLQVRPAGSPACSERAIPSGHWMAALRDVQADSVLTDLSRRVEMGALNAHALYEPQKERFVYYDGLIPPVHGLGITVRGEQVTLRSRAAYPVFDVTLVDRRPAGRVRVARIPVLKAGEEVKATEFEITDPAHWEKSASQELVNQLKTAGLFEDEARAMVQVWKKDFFDTDGLTLFYRLPQTEYDRRLPMTVRPRAERVIRVLFVHHPHCEPDLAERVLALVRELGNEDYRQRIEAQARLQKLGRAAFVHMMRARQTTDDAEVRARLDKLLQDFESQRAFPQGR